MSIIIDGNSGISSAGGTPIVNTTTNPTSLGTVTSITSLGNVSVTGAGYGHAFADGSLQTTVGYTGFRNRIINGGFLIDQRNSGASTTPTVDATYTLDRWQVSLSQASKFSIQQNAGSVTPPTGYKNYAGITSLSAYAVLATDYFMLNQPVEGLNVWDLGWGAAGAAPVTLSFWVRSSLTGTFGGAVQNSAQNRSYPYSYTINSANTWEFKTIVIPGDTTGTWLTTNGVGLFVRFALGVGANFSGTAGAWAGSQLFSVTGATSIVGTSGATFYVTGVQLERGSTATPFEFRQFGTELMLCQRYYSISGMDWQNYISVGYSGLGSIYLPVTVRAAATIVGTVTSSTNFASITFSQDTPTLGTNVRFSIIPTTSNLPARWIGTIAASAEL